jgi:REP element-mobilizing transposase RayT
MLLSSIAGIAHRLKQEGALQRWQLKGKLLRKHYWYQKLFRPDGYFVSVQDRGSLT